MVSGFDFSFAPKSTLVVSDLCQESKIATYPASKAHGTKHLRTSTALPRGKEGTRERTNGKGTTKV